MKRRHLKTSKGRGAFPLDILREIIRFAIADNEKERKAVMAKAKKLIPRKVA